MMVIVKRSLIIFALTFFVAPLHAVRTIPSLEHAAMQELFRQIGEDSDQLFPIFDALTWNFYRPFSLLFDDQSRAELSSKLTTWIDVLNPLADKASKSSKPQIQEELAFIEGKIEKYKFGIRVIKATWEDKPYRIRQSQIDKDLSLILKVGISNIDASQLNFTPEQFEKLISFNFLESLNLTKSITTKYLDNILRVSVIKTPSVRLPNLKKLSVADCDLQSGFILSWLKLLPHLEELDVSGNPLNTNVFHYLKNFHELKILRVENCKLKRRSVDAISKLQSLRVLTLDKNQLNPMQMEPLGQLQNLIYLSVSGNKQLINVNCLEPLKQLQCLNISKVNIAEDGLSVLKTLPSLIVLGISDIQLSDRMLQDIMRIESLQELRATSAGLTNQQARKLLAKSTLRKVFISRNNLTMTALEGFDNQGIIELDLSHNSLGDGGVKFLTVCSSLRRLDLSYTGLTDGSVAELEKFKKMTLLKLSGNALQEEKKVKLERDLEEAEALENLFCNH